MNINCSQTIENDNVYSEMPAHAFEIRWPLLSYNYTDCTDSLCCLLSFIFITNNYTTLYLYQDKKNAIDDVPRVSKQAGHTVGQVIKPLKKINKLHL